MKMSFPPIFDLFKREALVVHFLMFEHQESSVIDFTIAEGPR